MDSSPETPSDRPDAPMPPADAAAAPAPTSDERNLAVIAHLLGILLSFIGPLIIWLIKKDQSAYVNDQAREALNFQITMAIAYVISSVLTLVAIGCFLVPVVMVLVIVFSIIAAVAASRGEQYRYPLTIRLLS